MFLLRFLIVSILINLGWIFAFDFNNINENSNGEVLKVLTDNSPNDFLNEVSSAVLIDLNDKTSSLYNNWEEKQFYEKNILAAFTFANYFENDILIGKTNLKHFTENILGKILTEKEKRFYLAFSMPNFVKKSIDLPNLLKCKQLEENFEELVCLKR